MSKQYIFIGDTFYWVTVCILAILAILLLVLIIKRNNFVLKHKGLIMILVACIPYALAFFFVSEYQTFTITVSESDVASRAVYMSIIGIGINVFLNWRKFETGERGRTLLIFIAFIIQFFTIAFMDFASSLSLSSIG